MSLARILRIRYCFEDEKGRLLRCCFIKVEAATVENIKVQEYL